jgi:hypothetical protein
MILILPRFPRAGCTKPDTTARTTCPASLLVVHLAATPAHVVANQASLTPAPSAEYTSAAALEGPDPDTTSAAPAPETAVQLLQPLLRRGNSTFINSSHSLSFLFCKKMNEGTFYCYFTLGPTVLITRRLKSTRLDIFNPILHTARLDNHALTLKSNSAKYYFHEKFRFLHTFLKFCCESRKI